MLVLDNKPDKVKLWLGHYKWYILIALFFVIFITIMAVQTCSRDEHDISVMYAGPAVVADTQNAAIETALGKLAEDIDGDGKVEALFYDLIVMNRDELTAAYGKGHSTSSINEDTVQQAKDAFQLNILSDDHFVMMLSPERYDVMIENGALERFDDIGVAADVRYSDYAVKLSDLDFARFYTAFSVLPDDTLVCFKRISEVNADKKKVLERRADSIEFLKTLVEYKLPKGVIVQGEPVKRTEDGL